MSKLRITGAYFKQSLVGSGFETSHTGTPGVRLSIESSDGSLSIYIDYRQVATIAKALNGLGTNGDEIVVRVRDETTRHRGPGASNRESE